MARPLRIEYPGAAYHVMARGNQGRAIFKDDQDRLRFLDTLGQACGKTGWRIHAYILMGNHYHLLLETPEANLVAGMKWLQGTYTQRFNGRHEVRGHLFQGRSVYICPTAAAMPTVPPDPNPLTGVEPGAGPGPTFNYGMNQRINYNLPSPANVPETPFKITQAAKPSAFVVFSEQRVHAAETPYYGITPTDLSSTYNWCNRFSGRHNAGGNIVFSDAHVTYFKYSYVVGLVGGKVVDPKCPDINWEFDGH